jgi:putative oxidoreductase
MSAGVASESSALATHTLHCRRHASKIPRMRTPATYPDAGLLVLRLAVGAMLLMHGISKIQHGIGWIAGPLGSVGLPGWIAYGVYVGEIVAPLLLIIGLFTRAAALVIAFDLFMAIYLAKRGDVGAINPRSGGWAIELEALYLFAALAIALAGGGRFGIGKR